MITVCNPCATQSFKTFQLHLQDQFEKIATQRPDAFAHCQADAKKQFVNCLCGSILRDNPVRLSLDTTYRLGASVARLLANSISCYENLVSSAGHDTAIHVWQLADTRPGDTTARIMPSHDLHLSFH